MRLTILRMISTNSLSAFSTNPTAGAGAPNRVTAPAPVQQAQAQRPATPSTPGSGQGSSVSGQGFPALPQSLAPGQVLPRGSLLNLTV